MRFALLGEHVDGLNMARALVESGRHQLVLYQGAPQGLEWLRRLDPSLPTVGDLEEVLADPAIDLVIVAGALEERPHQLRRALQSERHVLCVHPPDRTPDIAYEAAMIQADTGRLLLPLLTEALHPGIRRLAEWFHSRDKQASPIRLMSWECRQALATDGKGRKGGQESSGSFPGWGVLRALGGEIAEVSAFAEEEMFVAEAPLLLSGRFERGGLFQVTLLPGAGEPIWRLTVFASKGEAELVWQEAPLGRVELKGRSETGRFPEDCWENWSPWSELVNIFERAVAGLESRIEDRGSRIEDGNAKESPAAIRDPRSSILHPRSSILDYALSWQDAIRSLELDDAVRRSLERRRASLLEYPEASEEVGFKGTMTLVGCGLLWVMVLLLVLSRWYPKLGWLILPLLILFLVLQLLRWVARKG
jgi:predicted dehydrogenase